MAACVVHQCENRATRRAQIGIATVRVCDDHADKDLVVVDNLVRCATTEVDEIRAAEARRVAVLNEARAQRAKRRMTRKAQRA